MDIRSGCGYPASALSNFAAHPFVFDGIQVNSMEGLLQSFKFDKPHIQKEVCLLVGFAAKARGRFKDWRTKQILYWQNEEYDRHGHEYKMLLDRAYLTLFQKNEAFRKALQATGDAELTHSIGKTNPHQTILTQNEFCNRLMWLRNLPPRVYEVNN